MGGASEHRYLGALDTDLEKALAPAARRAKKSPSALLREFVLEREATSSALCIH
jgi:hypothetical protein